MNTMPTAFTPSVAAEIWRDFPEYRALSITALNFHSATSPAPAVPLTPPIWMDAHLESWRAAFRRFGVNPKKTPSSVEALWKRVEKTGALPAIDPLVDLYNSLSIRFGARFGGEDADTYEGMARLTLASGTECFDTVRDGALITEHPEPGEIVWRDDRGITCRRWNWRSPRHSNGWLS